MVRLIASTDQDRFDGAMPELDTRDYPKGIKVSDAEMMTLNIKGDTFQWQKRVVSWSGSAGILSPSQIAPQNEGRTPRASDGSREAFLASETLDRCRLRPRGYSEAPG